MLSSLISSLLCFYFKVSQFIILAFSSILIINFESWMVKTKGKTEFFMSDTLKEMLEIQNHSYRTAVLMLVDDVKSEVRSLRKEVHNHKLSLQFTQGQVDDHKKISETTKAKMEEIEDRVKLIEANMDDYYSLETHCEDLEEKQDYSENMSRRNNIKILGLTEVTECEKTWEDMETLVKKTVREQLHVEKEILIEKAHCVGKPRPLHAKNSYGTNRCHNCGPEVHFMEAKGSNFANCKKIKPKEIKFCQDLSSRTLQRQAVKIPQLIRERKKGDIAYLVLD